MSNTSVQKDYTLASSDPEQAKPYSYLDDLADSDKLACLRCQNKKFLVYLSCGCHNIC